MNAAIRGISVTWLLAVVPAWGGSVVDARGGDRTRAMYLHDHGHKHLHARAEVGKTAPNFSLRGVDGKVYMLFKLRGKIVVLEWTNHQCPYVARHQAKKRTMQATYKKFKDKDVVWLAIDSSRFCEEKVKDIRAWVKKQGIAYPILLDASGKIGHIYGARTTPHMFVIDKKGVLAYSGATDDDPDGGKEKGRNYVEEALTALLAGSTIAVSSTEPYGCSVAFKE